MGLPVHSLTRRTLSARLRPTAARLSVAATALCAAAATVTPLALATAAKKTPDAIACPPAPAGWEHPPVTKSVSTPQTTSNGYGGGYEQVAAGGNAATVTCSYHRSADQVYVAVTFALPSDPNPHNDFDLGCGNGDARWDAANRVYRVSSPSQFALATLVDDQRSLHPGDVPAFQAVTRRLLQNAAGYAHGCAVVPKRTEVPARFFFDIRAGGDNIKSTFWTPPSPSKSGVFPIDRITPATARLQVETGAGARLLGVRLTKGIDYRLQTARGPARVRMRFAVTASKVASCRKGATGTLTISTPLTVQLDVCGHTFEPVVTSLIKIYTA